MFAKVFAQILDSSIADDYQTRHVFEDMLKLCDINGVVDMTHESIARRTNVPIELVQRAISELEKPDARSRNPDHDGRRIILLDAHRNWGWLICNYQHYRLIASEEQRREKTRQRVQRYAEREREKANAPLTHANATNAMQRQMEKKKNYDKASGPTKARKLSAREKALADRAEAVLGEQWCNDAGKWIGRIKRHLQKTERVIADVEEAIKRGAITTTPAQYAEQTWKEFK